MSQMKPAECDITTIKIKMKNGSKVNKYYFVSKKELITFLGYLKVLEFQKDEQNNDSEEVIDDIKVVKGDSLTYNNITALEKVTKPPQGRYNEVPV